MFNSSAWYHLMKIDANLFSLLGVFYNFIGKCEIFGAVVTPNFARESLEIKENISSLVKCFKNPFKSMT